LLFLLEFALDTITVQVKSRENKERDDEVGVAIACDGETAFAVSSTSFFGRGEHVYPLSEAEEVRTRERDFVPANEPGKRSCSCVTPDPRARRGARLAGMGDVSSY
jgi:hypothetical protein